MAVKSHKEAHTIKTFKNRCYNAVKSHNWHNITVKSCKNAVKDKKHIFTLKTCKKIP
jgi:hypothetical protein